MKAEIEIECSNPQVIMGSLRPDIEDAGKFDVELRAEDRKIRVIVNARDIAGLLAGVNSYLRLIRLSEEVQKNE